MMINNMKINLILSLILVTTTTFATEEITIKDKISQMIVAGFHGYKCGKKSEAIQMVKDCKVGGVILYNRWGSRNIHTPKQLQKLTRSLLAASREISIYKELPLLICVDQEGGVVDQLPVNQGFIKPNLIPQSLGQKNDPVFTLNYVREVAKFVRDNHLNVTFAPVVDLNINPVCPIIGGKGRSFSGDTKTVVEHAGVFIQAFSENKILTALKHFPGHGSATGDTHFGMVDVTDTWKPEELIPFKTLIVDKKYDHFVMVAHTINRKLDADSTCVTKSAQKSCVPATFSHKIITELLKNQWGFKGVVISDDLGMGAIADNYDLRTTLKQLILAGNDMLIISNHIKNNTAQVINLIEDLVKKGEIPESRINDAFNRIKTLKAKI